MANSKRQKREQKKQAEAKQKIQRERVLIRASEQIAILPVGSPHKMEGDAVRQQLLEADFTAKGIDYSAPGFYDHPAFVAVEKSNGRYLESYASYVYRRQYSPSYLNAAEEKIRRTIDFLYDVLKADGRQGACIDASNVLSRFLEQEGIWNCVILGGLVIDIPKLAPRYFWQLRHPSNPAKAGHAWVCAPPFRVVDLTICLQANLAQHAAKLPKYVVESVSEDTSTVADELFEPNVRVEFFRRYGRLPTLADAKKLNSELFEVANEFGIFWMNAGEGRLKYISSMITAAEAPLEGIKNFCPSVPNARDLYERFRALQQSRTVSIPIDGCM